MERITFGLLLADLSAAPQAGGYTGFGGIPGWIMTVYGEPNEYNLARVEAATVHELHHNLGGAAGAVFQDFMNVTVGRYIVGEGLAEAFAAELYGEALIGPWASEFDESDLPRVKAIFRDALDVSGFGAVRPFIFGDPQNGIPFFSGYAIGYRIVKAYLARTGKRVPEATFDPAETIIAESGYFD
jgi:uncharacterized protein YjaZ